MPSKKKTTAKKTVEEVASKSIEDISKSLLDIQHKTREALSQVDGAFIEKLGELENITEAIKLKNEELKELDEKEDILLNLQDLKEKLEDSKRDFDRNIKKMGIDFKDKESDLERSLRIFETKRKDELDQKYREMRITLEDEDRVRQLGFLDKETELQKREKEIIEKEEKLGNFEERVAAEVSNKMKSKMAENAYIQNKMEVEHRAEIAILQSKVTQLESEKVDLLKRVETAEQSATKAAERAQSIAISSLQTQAGKEALEELRGVAHEQAKAKR